MKVLALAVVLALTQLGCPLLDQNNGADASCDGGPTLGSQCQAVWTTFCNQGPRCGLGVPSNCAAAAVMQNCPCSVEDCDASSCETAPMVGACQQDLQTEDCNYIVNYSMPGDWPSDCQPFMGQR